MLISQSKKFVGRGNPKKTRKRRERKGRKKGQKLLRLALDNKFSTRYHERCTKYRKHLEDTRFQRKGKQGDREASKNYTAMKVNSI